MNKALEAAASVLAGGSSHGFTARGFSDQIVEYAKAKTRDGESPGQAIGRLADERDEQLEALAAARDAQSFREQHGKQLAKTRGVIPALEDQLDRWVAGQRQDDETHAQAYSRLAKTSAEFSKKYQALVLAKDVFQ